MKGVIEEKKMTLYFWLIDNFDFFGEEHWNTTVMQPWALDT